METFNFEAYNVYGEEIKFNTIESKFESGSSQRRAKWMNPLRRFILEFRMLSNEDAKAIVDFFIARKGSFEAFNWVNPNDEQTYTVVFDEDVINGDRFAAQLYDLGIVRLREVR